MNTKKLSQVASIIMGQSPSSSSYNYKKLGFPFFQGKAEFGDIHPTPIKWCSEPKRLAEKNDILISVRAPVGPTNIAKEKCCIGRGLAAIRANVNQLEQKYLYWFLKFLEPSLSEKGQGTTFKAINKDCLESITIPLPPLEEQKRIAAILDKADEIRRKRQEAIRLTEELVRSLFLDMFGDPLTNPKGWEVKKFIDIIKLKRGYDLPHQDRIVGEYPVIAANSIIGYHNQYKVKGPGIITGRSGTLGKVMFFEKDYWPLNTTLYSDNIKGNNPIYLTYFLRNFKLERFTRGTGVPTLNRNLIHSELAPYPPISLQNSFADLEKKIQLHINKITILLEKSNDLFNSLLQKAFQGKL